MLNRLIYSIKHRVLRDIGLSDILLASLTGCLAFSALPKVALDCSWFIWIAYVPLFFAMRGKTLSQQFVLGWIAGMVTNLGGYYWIPGLMVRFGGIPVIIAWMISVLLSTYQGFYIGLTMLLGNWWRTRGWPSWLVFPTAWMIFEYGAPSIFDTHIGLSQVQHSSIMQLAAISGPWILGGLILLTNCVLFEVLSCADMLISSKWRSSAKAISRNFLSRVGLQLLANTLLILVVIWWGRHTIRRIDDVRRRLPTLSVGIVQGNIGIQEKRDPHWATRILDVHQRETHDLIKAGAKLIVWPESAYPYGISRDRVMDYKATDLRHIIGKVDARLIFGALSYEPRKRSGSEKSEGDAKYYNTAFMLKDGKFAGYSDKNYLLAFGEYIPMSFLLKPLKRWVPSISEFQRGTETKLFSVGMPLRQHQGAKEHQQVVKIAPLICYEDILAGFVRRVVKLSPDLLVNITNDAWFGDTAEPYEHLGLAQFRSIENRLDMVRSVNTGVSAHIDMVGRVLQETSVHDPAKESGVPAQTLIMSAAIGRGGRTIFARYGPVAVYFSILLGVIMSIIRFGRPDISKSN